MQFFSTIVPQLYFQWSQFMADFGGNIGLWIWASIFTIWSSLNFSPKLLCPLFSATTKDAANAHKIKN